MGHIREEILERLVLEPSRIDPESSETIRGHLQECQACQAVVDYLRDFYDRFNALGSRLSPGVEQFADSVAPTASVIPLRSFTYKPTISPSEAEYTAVLAAGTDPTASGRYRNLATLAADDQDTIVRIVLDRKSDRVAFYVHASDSRRKEFSVISFPEIGLDFVCNQHGEIEAGPLPVLLSADFGATPTVLRTCVKQLDLGTADFTPHPVLGMFCERQIGSDVLRLGFKDSALSIESTGRAEEPFRYALVQPEGSSPVLVPLPNGSGRCSLTILPARLTVRFYQ